MGVPVWKQLWRYVKTTSQIGRAGPPGALEGSQCSWGCLMDLVGWESPRKGHMMVGWLRVTEMASASTGPARSKESWKKLVSTQHFHPQRKFHQITTPEGHLIEWPRPIFCWSSKWASLCSSSLRVGVLISHILLDLLDVSLLVFKARLYRISSSWCRFPGLGNPTWDINLHLLRGDLHGYILPACKLLHRGCGFSVDHNLSLPPTCLDVIFSLYL